MFQPSERGSNRSARSAARLARLRPRPTPTRCSTLRMSAGGAGSTRNCRGRIVVAEENASAALEVMSRFALAPQWLAYLPPTMSPSETSEREDGWNGRRKPSRIFARGVDEVVCEEKHMGSRAVIALCRTASAARARFGVTGDEAGAIWTRTGRPFSTINAMTEGLLARLRSRSTELVSGRRSKPTGSSSMPRSCPGPPRLEA